MQIYQSQATALVIICSTRCTFDANVATIKRPFVLLKISKIASATFFSEIEKPLTPEFVESLNNKVAPICPI